MSAAQSAEPQPRTRVPTALPFQLAFALAIITALIELGFRWGRWELTRRPIEAGADLVWMTPLANVVWLGLAALAAWLGNRLWPSRLGLGFVVGFISFPAWLSLLWLHPNLHRDAMVLLALGLAVQTGRMAAPRPAGTARLARRAALVTLPVIVLLAAGVMGRQWWREWQGMRGLPASTAGAPNILLLVLDTVRSYSLSTYGYPKPTTPTLDRLASEGVRFDRAFATAGWTLPSHVSMFTGRYADEVKTGPGNPMPKDLPTLAGTLRDAGYATGGFVANLAYTTWEYGVSRDFVRYEDYPVTPLTLLVSSSLGRKVFETQKVRHFVGYVDDADRKNAAHVQREFFEWVDDLGDRPFFAFINYFDAHHPYLPPAPFNTKFGPPLPPKFRPFPLRFRQLSAKEIPLADNVYHGAIAYIDDEMAKLVEGLRERGALDNTIIIVTSDHGEHLGDHELLSHGNSFYRQLLQVPLVVRYPAQVGAGTRVATPVSLRDLPATALDLAGVPNANGIPGIPLTPLVTDSAAPHSPVVSGRTLIGVAGAQSLISDGMHYIRMADGSEELYDLEADSLEVHSIVGTPQGEAALPALRSRLDSVNAAVPIAK